MHSKICGPRELVLASTSPYRRELLERLGIPFSTARPQVDESRLNGESADQLVLRLAEAKARSVADTRTDSLVVGSDQVAVLGTDILGKPGNRARAVEQLMRSSGQRVDFLTGLCLVDTAGGEIQLDLVPYSVLFRRLSEAQIQCYVDRDEPFNAAGSFKSEGLGIALFERMEGDDPTALVGLPLMRLIGMLAEAGVDVLLETD